MSHLIDTQVTRQADRLTLLVACFPEGGAGVLQLSQVLVEGWAPGVLGEHPPCLSQLKGAQHSCVLGRVVPLAFMCIGGV